MIYSRFTQVVMLPLTNEVDDTARKRGMIMSEKHCSGSSRYPVGDGAINLGARLQMLKAKHSSAVVASSGCTKNYAVARRL